MKCVLTIASTDSRFGGPSRSVPALGRALVALGMEVELIALQEGAHSQPDLVERLPENFRVTLIPTVGSRYLPFLWTKSFRKALAGALDSKELVLLHDNGVWLATNHCAVKAARGCKVPLVISPRGMLSTWALAAGKWKKKLAWSVYQEGDLQSSQLLHATSEQEAQEFRTLRLRPKIAVIPNGVELPPLAPPPSVLDPQPKQRVALFLSRIHPKKGLCDLVRAWANVRPVGWRMVIAGNDECGHQREIEQLATSLGVRTEFDFIGPVKDERKWEVYQNANIFILPSYSENFGIVIAEALAAGLPVITTRATPWQELEQHRCGWWIETGEDSLANALRTALPLPADELRLMGDRGRALVQQNYSWSSVGRRMIAAYESLLR